MALPGTEAAESAKVDGNRLTYLDENEPFYVGLNFPKLTTPQWIGEDGVEAVVILSIDDMTDPPRYEKFLRPILDRLKQIDGRAAHSIMTVSVGPQQLQLQSWLTEGLSLETHTLHHPCPLLARGDFAAAAENYHGCVELMNRVPGNHPVAFRMPCCDSLNSASPRFFAELFNEKNAKGEFLTIDSSVFNIATTNDAAVPREWLMDAEGREKFRKYLPFSSFVTTVENYPYPYVIGKLCWEFPCAVPSDWEAQHLHGTNNPATVADWKTAIDVTVRKQGVFTLVFHPHGWIRNDQIVELIDYTVAKYGKKVKFLNFREAQERLDKNLLAGQPLRAANGQKNGVRLLDVNNDGYLDVVIGNGQVRKTRIWDAKGRSWKETDFPVPLVTGDAQGNWRDTGVRFGVVRADGMAAMLVRSETLTNAWQFDGARWLEDKALLHGLELDGQPVFTRKDNRDRGVRLRDVDNDGRCELMVGNEAQSAILGWSDAENSWKRLPFELPEGTAIVDGAGHDNGLRFVDVNEDGFPDIVFSNPEKYSLHLFLNEGYVGLPRGWSLKIRDGKRGESGEIPMIVRGGEHPYNGAWFHTRHLWVQNEDTAAKPDLVDRRSFDELLALEAPPAKSPEESLACIKVRPGFKVELVAAEPLVKDPIAFEWGADGKLWVVEMGDYPLGVDGKGKAGGIVRLLEDTNGDGRYDKSTVFFDGLNFPNGIYPWRKGVIISVVPDIIYAEDTDGDGKADVKRVLFTGFHPGNQQHRANGYDYGLDNWLYGANGESGGEVTSVLTGRKTGINGRDFRFRPDTGEFETESGQTQYGRHRNDWGDWFGTNNPKWLWHYLFAEHYLRRNPHLPVPENKRFLANYDDGERVFAVSRTLERFNDPNGLEHVTSGNSPMPYRDELFGRDFATSVFSSEPVHNCVHREVLEADGITFKSHRAAGEEQSEFVASTDNWFRPTMLKTGPDGALYIADMYRLVIEHPEWIPAERQKRMDLRAGADLGRIYRVYPAGATLRKIPRLDKLNTKELVAALDSPNGWQRDTAQRLLVHAQNRAAITPLERMIAKSANPKARLQALCTLDGLGGAMAKILVGAMKDADEHVREQAVRASERSMSASVPANDKLVAALLRLADDPEIRVRYQLAFSLGEWADERAAGALAKIALRDWSNRQMQTAVLSSAPKHVGEMLAKVLVEKNPPAGLAEQLIGLATAADDEKVLARVLSEISKPREGQAAGWQFGAVAGLLDALDRRGQTLVQFREKSGAELRQPIDGLDEVFARARQVAKPQAIAAARDIQLAEIASAIRLLGRGIGQQREDVAQLGELLSPQVPGDVQKAALAGLQRLKGNQVAEVLVGAWKQLSPGLRGEALNTFFRRPAWTAVLLTAVEAGKIPVGQIGAPQQQKLLAHTDESIRARAEKLFAVTNADRRKILQDYQGVASLSGDPVKGAVWFQQNCMPCHRLKGVGTELGPDLGALAVKPLETLLAAILDPNQAVEARYVNYTAVTKDEREFSGIIVAETANSLTLRAAGGSQEVILRSDLKALTSSGLSLMPEGFEKALNPQAMADLLAFVRAK